MTVMVGVRKRGERDKCSGYEEEEMVLVVEDTVVGLRRR